MEVGLHMYVLSSSRIRLSRVRMEAEGAISSDAREAIETSKMETPPQRRKIVFLASIYFDGPVGCGGYVLRRSGSSYGPRSAYETLGPPRSSEGG